MFHTLPKITWTYLSENHKSTTQGVIQYFHESMKKAEFQTLVKQYKNQASTVEHYIDVNLKQLRSRS